jgi:hypothetical protein
MKTEENPNTLQGPRAEDRQSAALTIRALNPDDDSEVRQLCELYSSAIVNGSYPFSQVDSKDFWRNHAGQRFITATFRRGRTIVGHVGLRTDEFQPNVVELLFPMFSPAEGEAFGSFSEFCHAVRTEFDAFLATQSARKGWDWVIAYLPAAVPGMLDIAWKALGLTETAVMPLHRQRNSPTKVDSGTADSTAGTYSGDVVCLLRYAREGVTSNPFQQLVAPEHHSELALWISAKFGASSKIPALRSVSSESAPPASKERPVFESRMSRRLAARITSVYPEALTSNQKLLAHLRTERARPHLVSIEASHQSCRTLGSLMEELGYRFAGFLPFYRGGLHSVFALHDSSSHGSVESPFIISSELREESMLSRYLERANGGKATLGEASASPEHKNYRREGVRASPNRAA